MKRTDDTVCAVVNVGNSHRDRAVARLEVLGEVGNRKLVGRTEQVDRLKRAVFRLHLAGVEGDLDGTVHHPCSRRVG